MLNTYSYLTHQFGKEIKISSIRGLRHLSPLQWNLSLTLSCYIIFTGYLEVNNVESFLSTRSRWCQPTSRLRPCPTERFGHVYRQYRDKCTMEDQYINTMLYCKSTLVVSCTSQNTQISNIAFPCVKTSEEMGLKPKIYKTNIKLFYKLTLLWG